MRPFRDLPIKHKLSWLGVLASASALVMACAAFMVYDVRNFYQDMVNGAATQARIIGYNSAATILFFDPHTAAETLGALSTDPDVLAAGIYTRDGKLFASYTAGAAAAQAVSLPRSFAEPGAGHRFRGVHLELWRRIVFEQKDIGAILILTSLEAMRARLFQYIVIAALVLLVSTSARSRFRSGFSAASPGRSCTFPKPRTGFPGRRIFRCARAPRAAMRSAGSWTPSTRCWGASRSRIRSWSKRAPRWNSA